MSVDFDLESNIIVEATQAEIDAFQPQTFRSRFRRFLQTTKKCASKILALLSSLKPLIVIILYSLIGTAIFIALEKESDVEDKKEAIRTRKIARDVFLWRMNRIEQDTGPHDFDQRVKEAIIEFENNAGFDELTTDTDWNFWNTLFFAGTIYTTIGYGNIACSTPAGRTASMIYAILGIPLTLILLNKLGNILLKQIHRLSDNTADGFDALGRKLGFIHPSTPATIRKRTYSSSGPNVAIGVIGGVRSDSSSSAAQMALLTADEDREDGDPITDDSPPVLAAIFVTVGWLFFCSAIFCIWEDWTYFTSFYFFFISLSTIGFGDVTPEYPQFMIMNLPLVLVGLALVSVCIDVVREKLEKMYMALLKKLLQDYIKNMAAGGEAGASVQMMQSWGSSAAAKFLMPMLGKDKKAAVMHKFQQEAKKEGIELPDVLTNLDPESGLPSIFNVEEKEVETWLEEREEARTKLIDSNSAETQTTEALDFRTGEHVHAETQTEERKTKETSVQTTTQLKTTDSQTTTTKTVHKRSQTDKIELKVLDTKTVETVFETAVTHESESQTLFETETVETQTTSIELHEFQTQTYYSTGNICTQTELSLSDVEHQTSVAAPETKELAIQVYPEAKHVCLQFGLAPTVHKRLQTEPQLASVSCQACAESSEIDSQTADTVSLDSGIQTDWLGEELAVQAEPETLEQASQYKTQAISANNQTGASYFSRKEANAQTEKTGKGKENVSQTDWSSLNQESLETQTLLSLLDCKSRGSQVKLDVRSVDSQMTPERAHKGQQAAQERKSTTVQTLSSIFSCKPALTQTHLSFQDMTETGIQTALSSLFSEEKASQARAKLRDFELQVTPPSRERSSQAVSALRETEAQTVLQMLDSKHSQSQTQSQGRAVDVQTDVVHSYENQVSVGIQTGILARIEHLVSSNETEEPPETSFLRLRSHSGLSSDESGSLRSGHSMTELHQGGRVTPLPSVSDMRNRFESKSVRVPSVRKKKLKKIQSQMDL